MTGSGGYEEKWSCGGKHQNRDSSICPARLASKLTRHSEFRRKASATACVFLFSYNHVQTLEHKLGF
ncbi:hypothetical protein QL285_045177 [Trifolium repens]|nr:hypothetical protein QL285_045177 [Trifolium repens]